MMMMPVSTFTVHLTSTNCATIIYLFLLDQPCILETDGYHVFTLYYCRKNTSYLIVPMYLLLFISRSSCVLGIEAGDLKI